ncbi:serine hydrolase domain-containing protein [Flavobacterium caeni]|uniref:CubicO group peptidase, beta-lactamase class C family n=1 Tax=Flavobacterium caeni TaxID=490189 RepID=A0A1G5DWT9_9FLAO|nr:serine hydrolase [Flavobacterium caeni]SCY18960.1 CubicO group peptidase, beta-lactamase class C family [Flavobacterium caeni]
MKFLKKILIGLLAIVGLLVAALYLFDYDYLIKGVRTVYMNGHKTAFLDDYRYFDNRKLPKSTNPQPWAIATDYNKVAATPLLDEWHQKMQTVAFVVIKNDSIWNESYFDGYTKDSQSNSFSMAKSIVCAALGKAIQQGHIRSLDQPVSDFYPQYAHAKDGLTVGDLASMASGLDWDESYYSPFSITTRAYFDEDLDAVALSMKSVEPSGKSYKYLSGNTQLLAMCIQKATRMELSKYVSENFWQPLGAENNALWQTDHPGGMVKAYCCIASNARDFARFGKLFLQHGKWNGTQLLDSAFVAKSIVPRFADSPQYGYGWWLAEREGKQIFYMRGHLGQYTIVIPEDNVIIVRLGHRMIRSDVGKPESQDFDVWVSETLKMLHSR